MYAKIKAFSSLEHNNLIHLLQQRAKYQPNQTAYTFLLNGETEVTSLTYKELELKARFIGLILQNLGLTGERAILMYSPGLEFITAFFGCLYAGVVAVPAYPPRRNQSLERLQSIVADCQAKEVLTTTSVWKGLEQSLEQYPELTALRWLATDNLLNSPSSPENCQFPELNPDTLAFLQYTSGSTGTPKGVMVSHGNLLHNQDMIQKAFGHNHRSKVVGWLPLFHDMGLIGNVLQPLYLGRPCVLMSPVDFLQKPLRWLQAISQYQGTTSGGPNFAYDLCTRKVTDEQLQELDLSSWEVAFTGAEPVRADTLEAFAAKFAPCGFRKEAFYPCYGLAEATLFVSGGTKSQAPILTTVTEEALEQNPKISTKTLVGCGKAGKNQKIVLVDPDTLIPCPTGQVGEIWIAGPSVAQGYWNQPEKTREIFQAQLTGISKETFLRTGDLGFIREEGELFVTGRLKDVIIIRGRNHYPQDIEKTVEQAHPALKNSSGAAFAVEVDGEEKLVVVQEVERTHLRKLDIKQVMGNVRQALTAQHGLQIYEVALIKPGSIPKTSSGKIQRYLCRTKFLSGLLELIEKKEPISESREKNFSWSWQTAV